ncbi:hypothetical protein Taro_056712 [Colocasia esculenta]|uniref:Uncharacterized protein n=1 Tax=Colocasia esculenta TaxID=4460 RepID=A0A843XY89_COLES|nr:hypothetical protein [Colocasia esculenta]
MEHASSRDDCVCLVGAFSDCGVPLDTTMGRSFRPEASFLLWNPPRKGQVLLFRRSRSQAIRRKSLENRLAMIQQRLLPWDQSLVRLGPSLVPTMMAGTRLPETLRSFWEGREIFSLRVARRRYMAIIFEPMMAWGRKCKT